MQFLLPLEPHSETNKNIKQRKTQNKDKIKDQRKRIQTLRTMKGQSN